MFPIMESHSTSHNRAITSSSSKKKNETRVLKERNGSSYFHPLALTIEKFE